jgi:hypothetical protein
MVVGIRRLGGSGERQHASERGGEELESFHFHFHEGAVVLVDSRVKSRAAHSASPRVSRSNHVRKRPAPGWNKSGPLD